MNSQVAQAGWITPAQHHGNDAVDDLQLVDFSQSWQSWLIGRGGCPGVAPGGKHSLRRRRWFRLRSAHAGGGFRQGHGNGISAGRGRGQFRRPCPRILRGSDIGAASGRCTARAGSESGYCSRISDQLTRPLKSPEAWCQHGPRAQFLRDEVGRPSGWSTPGRVLAPRHRIPSARPLLYARPQPMVCQI